MNRQLKVRLLGRFDVSREGKPIAIASRPAQSLFAYLILNAGIGYRREKLAGMLWPDSLEETARDNLRHALWRMRKALEAASSTRYLHADDLTISFKESSDYWLDAAELEKLAENATADELMAILTEYQGELLPGFYVEWVVLEREHLNSVFEHKMARLLSLLQDENRWLDILDWGERWIKLGQKPEPAYRALMSAHAAKGDMSKVAVTYERCVKSLKEFGIEPSEQTRALYEKLKAGKGTVETTFVALVKEKRRESPKSNLPVPVASFIGREAEVETIIKLLGKKRLLTLTGSGGVGKTRLAIQSASKLISKFRDGVWWVDLVGLNDPSLVPQTVAQAVNIREVSNQPVTETLIEYFQVKHILLVLDNCEHLISACAQLADRLLSGCQNLRVLTTSREALDILGETTWSVPSLTLPLTQELFSATRLSKFEGIRLFTERASLVQPNFELTDQNAGPVVEICKRLSGMPLAIELAAARVKMMSVGEIAERLDDRFNLLTSGNRAALPRHQTLRATIDWSYDLLMEPERSLFRRLAVFAGGFTLEAAEAVCGFKELKRDEVLDLVGRLVDKSLVIVETAAAGEETRYSLLETIRQYALERLAEIGGEAQAARDQHLEFCIKLAEDAEPNTFGEEAAIWFRRLDKELDNLRTAIDWSIERENAIGAMRLVGALNDFFLSHGPLSEWKERLGRVLSLPGGSERTLARAKVLNGIGYLYWAEIDPGDKHTELEEALAIGREIGDKSIIAIALRNLGLFENLRGDPIKARSYLEKSLKICRELELIGRWHLSLTLIFLGDVALNQGELDNARQLYEESVSILREGKDRSFLAYSVRRLGQLACHRGDYEAALGYCVESLRLNLELGDPFGVIASLAAFAGISLGRGQTNFAVELIGAVQALLNARSLQLFQIDQSEYENNVALLRPRLNQASLEKELAKGARKTLEQTLEFVWKEFE